MILQDYQTEISNEHVILGNEAIFKCSIPSFVSDFVTITAWVDNKATSFELNSLHHGKCSMLLHIDNVEDSAWTLKSFLKVSRTHYTDKLINTNPGW